MTSLRLLLPVLVLTQLLSSACSDGSVTSAPEDNAGGSAGTDSALSAGGSGGVDGSNGGSSGAPATTTSAGGSGMTVQGLGVGEDCSEADCRAGLLCEDERCELAGTTEPGEPCVASGECQSGLVCVNRTCSVSDPGLLGDSCQSDLNCASGQRCSLVGFTATCQAEGSGDLGASCELSGECLGGLACLSGVCALPPTGLPAFGLPFQGVECEEPDDDGVRAYFEVPGAQGALEGDFFRLPFPNDVRLSDGSPDLEGFPTPGSELLGIDPVKVYLDRIEQEHSGWGTEPKVLFRFSGRVDHETFTGEQANTEGRVRVIDVTPGIAEQERDPNVGWQMYYTTGRSNYVCHHWFGISRPLGAPMRAGHTYAFILSNHGRDFNGDPIERSENLEALLADEAPDDAALSAAHAAYAPLRDYLASDNGNDSGRVDLKAADVLNATVVTVQDHQDVMRELALAVEREFETDAPMVSDWVLCDEGVQSPCPEAEGERGCQAAGPDYDEYHAMVTLPIFQRGDAPYLSEGGGIITSEPERMEEVCLSLTVPTSVAPAAGWPLVLFAHGTGGSFRSHVRDEVAGVLANAAEPFAVLGIDQVQHGPRRGGSEEEPETLFFNFLNPDAARGNPLQGAADQLSLLHLARTLDLTAQDTGGEAIRVDATKIVFLGHSQGSTHGSLMLPYADVPGAVLSGNGAGLRYSLLTKTEPVDIAHALPFVLGDPASDGTLNMAHWHPALSMLQQWIDAADPYNFAQLAAARPEAGQAPLHLFQTFGIDDNYSPPITLFAYGRAARATMAPLPSGVDPVDDNMDSGLPPDSDPVSGNRSVDGSPITIAMRQYAAPDGSDGHFVIFDVATANQDVVSFIEAVAAGEVPSVPAE